jgi:hypothetical protein
MMPPKGRSRALVAESSSGNRKVIRPFPPLVGLQFWGSFDYRLLKRKEKKSTLAEEKRYIRRRD